MPNSSKYTSYDIDLSNDEWVISKPDSPILDSVKANYSEGTSAQIKTTKDRLIEDPTSKVDEPAKPKAETDKLLNSTQDNNTPESNATEAIDDITDLDIVTATPKADEAAKPKAETDKLVASIQQIDTPDHDTSAVSDEDADLAILIAALKANELKSIADKSVDSVQDDNTAKRDTNIVSDDNIVSDKETDLDVVVAILSAESETTTDKLVDSVRDDNTPERATDVVSDKIIDLKKSTDLDMVKTAEPKAITHEFSDFTPQADAPSPVHVTTGSSLTPKSRLTKTPKLIANGSRAFIWYALALVMLILDQWTKWLAETNLTFNEPVPVIEPFLNWTLAYNSGAAFSFLADAGGWQKWFFSGLSLLVSLFLIVYLVRVPRKAKLLSTGLALILSGAIGNNLIDRPLHGHVIDFIHIHYANVWHYPIFNIADIAICIGVAIVVIDMIFLEGKRSS